MCVSEIYSETNYSRIVTTNVEPFWVGFIVHKKIIEKTNRPENVTKPVTEHRMYITMYITKQ